MLLLRTDIKVISPGARNREKHLMETVIPGNIYVEKLRAYLPRISPAIRETLRISSLRR